MAYKFLVLVLFLVSVVSSSELSESSSRSLIESENQIYVKNSPNDLDLNEQARLLEDELLRRPKDKHNKKKWRPQPNHHLGDSCHEIEGCPNEVPGSLICFAGKCQCGPGFVENDTKKNVTTTKGEHGNKDECRKVNCDNDEQCQRFDDNRRCSDDGRCDRCTNGLRLDKKINRCVTRLGSACKMESDCRDLDQFNDFGNYPNNQRNHSEPICRSGRCICPVNFYPDDRWTQCTRGECKADASCLMFGVDPYRICSTTLNECVCPKGYYEDSFAGYCTRHYILVYSYYHMMFPFLLAIISAIVLILAYITRRYYQQRLSAIESASTNNMSPSIFPPRCRRRSFPRSEIVDPKFLYDSTAPPPSYDEVIVKSDAMTDLPDGPSTSSSSTATEAASSSSPIQMNEMGRTQIKSLSSVATIPTTSLSIDPTNTLVTTVASSTRRY